MWGAADPSAPHPYGPAAGRFWNPSLRSGRFDKLNEPTTRSSAWNAEPPTPWAGIGGLRLRPCGQASTELAVSP